MNVFDEQRGGAEDVADAAVGGLLRFGQFKRTQEFSLLLRCRCSRRLQLFTNRLLRCWRGAAPEPAATAAAAFSAVARQIRPTKNDTVLGVQQKPFGRMAIVWGDFAVTGSFGEDAHQERQER
jgi:hypothetical protein